MIFNNRLNWMKAAAVLQLAASTLAGAAAFQPVSEPRWKGRDLGRIDYSYRGDLRRGQEMLQYRLNQDGVILADDFLKLARPGELEMFTNFLRISGQDVGTEAAVRERHQKYLSQAGNEALAVLIFGNILDHEAMKRKFPPKVSENRVEYVVRSILTQNSADMKKIRVREEPVMTTNTCPMGPRVDVDWDKVDWNTCAAHAVVDAKGNPELSIHPAEDVSRYSSELLYTWLKEAVGPNQISASITWEYNEGGTALLQQSLRSSKTELPWGKQTMKFGQLPKTLQGFRDGVRDQLQAVHRQTLRALVLERLVQERFPMLATQMAFGVTTQQMERMYAAIKNSSLKIDHLKADFYEIRLEGEKAEEFAKKVDHELEARERQYDAEFSVSQNQASSPENDRRLMEYARQLRQAVPLEVFHAVEKEFAAEISSGRLKASIAESSAARSSTDPVSTEQSYRALRDQYLFDSRFGAMRLFPRVGGLDQDRSLKLIVLRQQETLAPTYRDKDAPGVEQYLRRLVTERLRGKAYRDLAYTLFSENHFTMFVQTCSQPEWPCISRNSQSAYRWAELLFPETLYPGMSYPASVTSSLRNEQYMDRVMSISLELLSRIFGS